MKLRKLLLVLPLLCATYHLANAQSSDVLASDKKKKDASAAKTPPSVSAPVNGGKEVASVKNMSIVNGDKDDFSPMFFENGLLFCSNSKKKKKDDEKDKTDEDLNFKFAPFDSLGNLMKPSGLIRRLNSKTHEGPSCFNTTQDTMYLTRMMSKGGVMKLNKQGEATLKIYVKSRDTSGNFVGEMILPFESETYSYCHPTLSADGKRLYFASNMPGSLGGMDIWVSRRLKEGNWSQPINLGPKVNSSKNELFPHITEKNTLYYASNGRPDGKGGLDIFRIEIENRASRAYPMGEQFNTEGDDFGIMFLPKNDKKGYFSSNRKGGTGGDDIYEFEIK
jgi:WD40-like Beta Propeller Repeat